MSDDDDLFGSSGKYRSISFKGSPPITHRDLMVLEHSRKTQARDPQTGEPKFFPIRGTKTPDLTAPIWQWVIKVQLSKGFAPDKDIVEEYGHDDGVRFLYVGGKADPSSRSSRAALIKALTKAGVRRVEPGGVFPHFTYVADGPQENRAFNPPKFYEAEYAPPKDGANGGGTEFSDGVPLPEGPSDDDEPPF